MQNTIEDLNQSLLPEEAARNIAVQKKVYNLNNHDDKIEIKDKIIDILKRHFKSQDGLERDFLSILADLQCQEEKFNDIAIPLSTIQRSRDQLFELRVLMKEIFTEKELHKTSRAWYTLWIGTSVSHSRMKDNALQVIGVIATVMFKVLNRAIEKIDRLEVMVQNLQKSVDELKTEQIISEKKHEKERVKNEQERVKHEQERVKHEQERVKHEQERVKHEQERVKNEERFHLCQNDLNDTKQQLAFLTRLVLGFSQGLGMNPDSFIKEEVPVHSDDIFNSTDKDYNKKVKADVKKLPVNLATSKSISQSTFNGLKNNSSSQVEEVNSVTAQIRKGSDKTETSEYPTTNEHSWIGYTNHKVEQDQYKNDFSTIG